MHYVLLDWWLFAVEDEHRRFFERIVLGCFGVAVPGDLGFEFEWDSLLDEGDSVLPGVGVLFPQSAEDTHPHE